jgi:hypothetical protein
MAGLLERLEREGLLSERGRERLGADERQILRLCNDGALLGGLSVALDVRPDEAVGPLCVAIGGGARALRVLDVRDRPSPELRVRLGDLEERWELGDVPGLVHNLNDLLRDDREAKAVAVLGEWEDAHQFWCLPKQKLPSLLRAEYFEPRNRAQLEELA